MSCSFQISKQINRLQLPPPLKLKIRRASLPSDTTELKNLLELNQQNQKKLFQIVNIKNLKLQQEPTTKQISNTQFIRCLESQHAQRSEAKCYHSVQHSELDQFIQIRNQLSVLNNNKKSNNQCKLNTALNKSVESHLQKIHQTPNVSFNDIFTAANERSRHPSSLNIQKINKNELNQQNIQRKNYFKYQNLNKNQIYSKIAIEQNKIEDGMTLDWQNPNCENEE